MQEGWAVTTRDLAIAALILGISNGFLALGLMLIHVRPDDPSSMILLVLGILPHFLAVMILAGLIAWFLLSILGDTIAWLLARAFYLHDKMRAAKIEKPEKSEKTE
jgi:hypothetical protein